MCHYLRTRTSNLSFLQKFSPEQIEYITNLEQTDNKILACAGSGKTRSIIGRIKFLVEHSIVKKEEVYVITFSRLAASDFHRKVQELFLDHGNFCDLKNFSTIDSLAKSVLCQVRAHKSENVEILSIAFRNYLREVKITEALTKLFQIKYLFIDEAQDLNEVQYDIAMLLKEKFGTIISLVGDPNQNIYPFRRSSNVYLLNFPAKQFDLTLNFRSTQEIIDFSDCLKPITMKPTTSANKIRGPKVSVMSRATNDIHQFILQFIKQYQRDLSNIAIICPTRGIGSFDNLGLSVFFNLFKTHNIPFNQLYEESGNSIDSKRVSDRKTGHLNLMTYHGTKGLEFDTVFVMDFYQFLFNIKPTDTEYKTHQYLLYVATSRAINQMFICTYTNVHGGYLSHHLTSVNPDHYVMEQTCRIPALSFRHTETQVISGITDIINALPDTKLDTIHDILDIREHFTRRIYPDHTDIDRGSDEVLFGIFCEELFYLQYYLARKQIPRPLILIQRIIEAKYVIVDSDAECKLLKKFIINNDLTWAKYDLMRRTLDSYTCSLIEKYFPRSRELTDCVICTNCFVQIINNNSEQIKEAYQNYLCPEQYQYSYSGILEYFFYLIVVQYAYNINHYYYINNRGKEKSKILEAGTKLFVHMNMFASTTYHAADILIKIPVTYNKLMLCGEIDFVEQYHNHEPTIVEIKCGKEISIKYYIQLLLYNFCYYYQQGNRSNLFVSQYKIINLLTGLEHYLVMSVSPANMFNILITVAEAGGLTFNNMNLVYDLETTDKIKTFGPFPKKINAPRTECYYAQNRGRYIENRGKGVENRGKGVENRGKGVENRGKGVENRGKGVGKSGYYAKRYPEIIDIAIKDYETGMVLIDTLVKPIRPIVPEVQQLTGITPDMLVNSAEIDAIRLLLEYKLKNFTNGKMMAHNGSSFDNLIMLYDKLINPKNISFIDTMSIIPTHLPTGTKLESKGLGHIYATLFQQTFKAHRAMADVDALCRIMRKLRIRF